VTVRVRATAATVLVLAAALTAGLTARSPDAGPPGAVTANAAAPQVAVASLIPTAAVGADARRQAAAAAQMAHAVAARHQGRELRVGAGAQYATLAAALQDARDGDVVRVLAGTYAESGLELDHSIALVGEPGAVIDNAGTGGLLRITADDVVVRGLILRGTPSSHVHDHAAVLVEGGNGCVIEDNRFEDNYFAIYLARSRGCRVARNVITASADRESSAGNGIHLWNTAEAEIGDNVIRGHRDGIYLEHVSGTLLRHNTSEDNLRYGLHFMFSNGNRYIGNAFRRNGAGVAVMYSNDVEVRGNVFEDNWGPTSYGLLLKDIYDSVIADNAFIRNTVALSSEGSTRVEVRGNRFVRNGWAARVMANSQENTFRGNDFIDNTFDVTTNSRHNYNTFDGNYWSRYTGYDLAGDGVGDVPHRPVRLFSLLVQRTPAALVLLRSAFVDVLEVAERVAPVLTPETLVDSNPLMREAVR
jgi:nitrous oxidase accessory protein